jgi:transposase-like protein
MKQLSKGATSKRFTPEQKFEAVLLNISGAKTVKELMAELGTSNQSILNWKKEFFAKAPAIFQNSETVGKVQAKEERTIERLGKEVQFLKKLLAHYRQTRDKLSSPSPGQ